MQTFWLIRLSRPAKSIEPVAILYGIKNAPQHLTSCVFEETLLKCSGSFRPCPRLCPPCLSDCINTCCPFSTACPEEPAVSQTGWVKIDNLRCDIFYELLTKAFTVITPPVLVFCVSTARLQLFWYKMTSSWTTFDSSHRCAIIFRFELKFIDVSSE